MDGFMDGFGFYESMGTPAPVPVTSTKKDLDKSKVCPTFSKLGLCYEGNSCPFRHVEGPETKRAATEPEKPASMAGRYALKPTVMSKSVKKFRSKLNRLKKRKDTRVLVGDSSLASTTPAPSETPNSMEKTTGGSVVGKKRAAPSPPTASDAAATTNAGKPRPRRVKKRSLRRPTEDTDEQEWVPATLSDVSRKTDDVQDDKKNTKSTKKVGQQPDHKQTASDPLARIAARTLQRKQKRTRHGRGAARVRRGRGRGRGGGSGSGGGGGGGRGSSGGGGGGTSGSSRSAAGANAVRRPTQMRRSLKKTPQARSTVSGPAKPAPTRPTSTDKPSHNHHDSVAQESFSSQSKSTDSLPKRPPMSKLRRAKSKVFAQRVRNAMSRFYAGKSHQSGNNTTKVAFDDIVFPTGPRLAERTLSEMVPPSEASALSLPLPQFTRRRVTVPRYVLVRSLKSLRNIKKSLRFSDHDTLHQIFQHVSARCWPVDARQLGYPPVQGTSTAPWENSSEAPENRLRFHFPWLGGRMRQYVMRQRRAHKQCDSNSDGSDRQECIDHLNAYMWVDEYEDAGENAGKAVDSEHVFDLETPDAWSKRIQSLNYAVSARLYDGYERIDNLSRRDDMSTDVWLSSGSEAEEDELEVHLLNNKLTSRTAPKELHLKRAMSVSTTDILKTSVHREAKSEGTEHSYGSQENRGAALGDLSLTETHDEAPTSVINVLSECLTQSQVEVLSRTYPPSAYHTFPDTVDTLLTESADIQQDNAEGVPLSAVDTVPVARARRAMSAFFVPSDRVDDEVQLPSGTHKAPPVGLRISLPKDPQVPCGYARFMPGSAKITDGDGVDSGLATAFVQARDTWASAQQQRMDLLRVKERLVGKAKLQSALGSLQSDHLLHPTVPLTTADITASEHVIHALERPLIRPWSEYRLLSHMTVCNFLEDPLVPLPDNVALHPWSFPQNVRTPKLTRQPTWIQMRSRLKPFGGEVVSSQVTTQQSREGSVPSVRDAGSAKSVEKNAEMVPWAGWSGMVGMEEPIAGDVGVLPVSNEVPSTPVSGGLVHKSLAKLTPQQLDMMGWYLCSKCTSLRPKPLASSGTGAVDEANWECKMHPHRLLRSCDVADHMIPKDYLDEIRKRSARKAPVNNRKVGSKQMQTSDDSPLVESKTTPAAERKKSKKPARKPAKKAPPKAEWRSDSEESESETSESSEESDVSQDGDGSESESSGDSSSSSASEAGGEEKVGKDDVAPEQDMWVVCSACGKRRLWHNAKTYKRTLARKKWKCSNHSDPLQNHCDMGVFSSRAEYSKVAKK